MQNKHKHKILVPEQQGAIFKLSLLTVLETTHSEDHSPCRDGTDGLLVDGDELVQHYVSCGEDAIRVEEGVQEIDGEEAQVGQPLQQALHTGVADLQHLTGVHHLAEADVNIIAVQAGIRPALESKRG